MTPTVILVTDPAWPLVRIEEVVLAAAEGLGPERLAVQLRDKRGPLLELAAVARRLRALTSRVGAQLVLNAATDEHVAVAADVGADGAHVPCTAPALASARAALGEGAWISTPAHVADEVGLAAASGADAALVSPIWESPGKGPARGLGAIREARARVGARVRLYALGGIDASRAAACAEAGADGVAVIRALLAARDPKRAAELLDAPFHRRP